MYIDYTFILITLPYTFQLITKLPKTETAVYNTPFSIVIVPLYGSGSGFKLSQVTNPMSHGNLTTVHWNMYIGFNIQIHFLQYCNDTIIIVYSPSLWDNVWYLWIIYCKFLSVLWLFKKHITIYIFGNWSYNATSIWKFVQTMAFSVFFSELHHVFNWENMHT